MINQSIKFFTIFLLAFNVFAGGDDRDEGYYEALDEDLAAFKAELASHEECKAALNLSDSNIALFKTALAAGNLFSVGPQITAGTEFTANRWDDYASCIGALGYTNPF